MDAHRCRYTALSLIHNLPHKGCNYMDPRIRLFW